MISYISEDRLTALGKLLTLDLSSNLLSYFPDLLELRLLYLSENKFTTVPNLTASSISLRNLALSDNELTDLDGLIHLQNLLFFNIEFNPLANVSEFFSLMPNLTNLRAGYMDLTEWPDLSQALSLEVLILNRNKLQSIPTSLLVHLPLISLQLTSNKIPIESIEDINIPTLEELVLHNQGDLIIQFPRWQNLSQSIKILRLGWNEITSLVDEDLTYFTQLSTLDLQGNKIATMPLLWTTGHRLTTLNLGYNDIQSMTLQHLQLIPNCTELIIKRNELTELPNICLADFQMASTLIVSDNPLHCTGRLLATLQLSLNDHFKYDVGEGRCASPEELEGATVAQLEFHNVSRELRPTSKSSSYAVTFKADSAYINHMQHVYSKRGVNECMLNC
jgi:Leucine-rich repeat (LRR) protein